MDKRKLVFEIGALEELKVWMTHDIRVARKIIELCENALSQPFKGIGKPEPLKHDRQGYWSRRINKVDRLVYKVTADAIIVISCKYHY